MPPLLEADRLRFALGDISIASYTLRNASTFRSMQPSVLLERVRIQNVAHFETPIKHTFDVTSSNLF